jgi:hypothetical protein
MNKKTSSYNILVGKHVPNTGMIINQALIDLLLEKGVFSVEELHSKIVEIRKEVDKKDTYKQ